MAHNMKGLRVKIDKIEKEGRKTLKFVRHEARAEGSRNKETFAAISDEGVKTGMVGRNAEKEKIINLMLRNDANEAISIIPIVGLGGIGKSTLAESVLVDKRVNVFDIHIWVHVSEQFDLHKIGSRVIKRLNSSIILDNCDLQFLHDNIKKELANLRYLIVLDDLWEEDGSNLEELKRMLQYGRKGSRIVVTTRNHSVVQELNAGFLAKERKICPVPESDQIILGVLSADDCWEVMKQRAYGLGDDDLSVLEKIGRQIAEKCGGIPLVANALGQVMFELRTVDAWKDIRDTKVNLGLREVHQNQTLERLMLSYYYMKLDFKICFSYLAAFPKGFVVDNDRLIQQWIALGYICTRDDGQRCINYLIGMSFLQISKSPSASRGPRHPKAPRELTMHDLVHDLASIITANEFLVVDANAPETRTWNRPPYCRHAQLINYHNQSKVFRDLPSRVRSLHFRASGKMQLPQMAFSRSKHLRVLDLNVRLVSEQSTPSNLDLRSTGSKTMLPSSIHQSKLLRYLDATALPITSLPKYFHTLQYMQTLILSKCSFEALPENICSLDKLCYLDLSGCSSLKKLPSSLGKLSKLSFLNLSKCLILQGLPDPICELAYLRDLDMSDCHAIQKLPAKFGILTELIFLNLSGCSKLTKLPENISLESLEHLNLSNCHELENLPQDVGNLQNLRFLNLSDCYKVTILPESFCQIRHLKDLDFSDCHSLRELPDCFGNLHELDSLNLTSCCKLRLLPESFHKLLKLRHLNLSCCMMLKKLPSSLGALQLHILDISCAMSLRDLPDSILSMTSLTKLEMTVGGSTVFKKVQDIRKHLNLPGLTVHTIQQMEKKICSSMVELAQLTCYDLRIEQLQNVRHPEDATRARLRDKSDLLRLNLQWDPPGEQGKSVLENLIPPRNLENFMLDGYMSKDFPNWMSHISSYLPSLTLLRLSDLGTCDTLPPFGVLPNLRILALQNIHNVSKIGKEFYGEGRTCTKLRMLKLESMSSLVEWWTTQSGEENEEFLIPNLHLLELKNCPKLKFRPYPPRSMMWWIRNTNDALPQGGFGKLSSSTVPFEMSIGNCNFSWDRLQHFSTLEALEFFSCSNLRALPEAIRCLTSLRLLELESLEYLELLPEWLGLLTSLERFTIEDCPMVTFLPQSIKDLTTLKELHILKCPSLVERCQGEDADLISHIPEVTLH
uniref:Uncharacterized protein n=3 Tax=Avena sativa TaxID=4498 RepID=A0ACD5XFS6_AVESA